MSLSHCKTCKEELPLRYFRPICKECLFSTRIVLDKKGSKPLTTIQYMKVVYKNITNYCFKQHHNDYRETQADLIEYADRSNKKYNEIEPFIRIKDFQNDIQVNLSRFYYQKLWITYG